MKSNKTKQRVLVTGGTGFTGAHLVRRLLGRGHEVRVVDNQKGLFYDELKALGAQISLGSVTDRRLMDEVVAGCEVVHHLAAAFRKINLPKEVYWDVNVNGTRYLLEAAAKHQVRKVVYCSTCGVHGNVSHPPAPETDPIAPADYYQVTKYEGEKVAQGFIREGLDVTILRPAAIYGPGDPGRWLMLFKRVAKGWFPMFGDGQATYHPLYIEHLIDAFELAVAKEESKGQTYLIADAQYYTLNELVELMAQALKLSSVRVSFASLSIIRLPFFPLWLAALACEGICSPLNIPPPLFRRRVDWYRQNRAFDISKAKQELGYQPKVELLVGLEKTGTWYREHGYL
jgi:nucleoside-diphosphate-sugar epimerase